MDRQGSVSGPLAIYGAGKIGRVECESLRAQGIEPVCFCDSNPDKWGSEYVGLRVISLEQARREHTDLRLRVAIQPPAKYQACIDIREKDGFPVDRIENFEDYVFRRSCLSLEYSVQLRYFGMITLCNEFWDGEDISVNVPRTDNIEESLAALSERREQLIRENQDPEARNICAACLNLTNGYWHHERKVRTVHLGGCGPCQLQCSYCRVVRPDKFPAFRKEDMSGYFLRLIDYLRQNNLYENAYPNIVAVSEMAVYPNRDAILDALAPDPILLLTNAVAFNERMAALTARPDSKMIVSLDAGTRETFARVKGRDKFEAVINNLREYRARGTNLILKYIMLEENIDERDLDGFVRIAEDLGATRVTLSCDDGLRYVEIPEVIVGAAMQLLGKVVKSGMAYEIYPYFGPENLARIRASGDNEK